MSESPFRIKPGHSAATPGASMSGPEAEERVVSAVVEAILGHRIAPGTRLIERELANYAGASRSAIRNGLLTLAHAGLVELSPNKGATIAMCSPEEARQIFEARIVIEAAVLDILAHSLDDAGRTKLAAFIDEEHAAYEAGRMEEARHLSRRFHLLVAELSGNDVLTGFVRDLINRQPLLSWTREARKSRFCGNEAHQRIADALARGDGAEAARLNTEHLRELELELRTDRDSALKVVGAEDVEEDPRPRPA